MIELKIRKFILNALTVDERSQLMMVLNSEKSILLDRTLFNINHYGSAYLDEDELPSVINMVKDVFTELNLVDTTLESKIISVLELRLSEATND